MNMQRIILLLTLLVTSTAIAQNNPATLDELLRAVRVEGQQRSAESKAREQRFVQARDQQRALLQQATRSLNEANARSDRLKISFDDNEKQLGELSETLRVRVGNMGELFGVVRQVAGDSKGIVDTSLVSAQLRERSVLANRLAQSKGLPSMGDLRDLYVLLLEEMAESGKVTRFNTELISADGVASNGKVVRVGVFNTISGDRFLNFDADTQNLHVLPRQPAGRFRSMASDLFAAREGNVAMAVDPSRGTILALLIQKPGLLETINQGSTVGYVIIFLGVLGLLVSVERLLVLLTSGRKIKSQLKDKAAREDNALGRILKVHEDNRDVDTETLELKLEEAILREAPKLEKRQGWIKVFAAVAPLLGLLGTVVGMIGTFQAITLYGTGDPKLMAGGISQALVTTVLGLVVAIPLVLLHSMVAGRSKSLVEVLEEQSAGIIARHSEAESHI